MKKKGKWYRHSAEELVLAGFALAMAFTGWLFSPPVSPVSLALAGCALLVLSVAFIWFSLAAPAPQRQEEGKEKGQDAAEAPAEKAG